MTCNLDPTNPLGWLALTTTILFMLCGVKAIIGVKFPWEARN